MEKIINSIFEKDQIIVSNLSEKQYFERNIEVVDFKIV
jgi:hypothetical protein